jgi:hypothetical protein
MMQWFKLPESLQVVEDFTLKQLVERYNANYGTGLHVRGKSVLLLPTEIIQAFFLPAISKCLHHVKELLEVNEQDQTEQKRS